MNDLINVNEKLEIIGQVLIRCFIIAMIMLLYWWGALTFMGDLTYSVHSRMFPISREQFDIIHYSGMLIFKAVIFVIFLIPYISMKLVIRKRRE